jgi:hypothetical protein
VLCRQEEALLEAYQADGWRGASREKVKPVAELERARRQVNRIHLVLFGMHNMIFGPYLAAIHRILTSVAELERAWRQVRLLVVVGGRGLWRRPFVDMLRPLFRVC